MNAPQTLILIVFVWLIGVPLGQYVDQLQDTSWDRPPFIGPWTLAMFFIFLITLLAYFPPV